MKRISGFLASLVLACLATLMIDACSKTESPAPVAVPVVAVVEAPKAVVSAPIVTPVGTAATPAATSTKVVAVKRKSPASSSDTAAYAKAKANAARAACLRKYVDMKLDGDVKLGRVRNFDSVLTSGICKPAEVVKAATHPTHLGAKAHGAKKHSTTGHKTPAAKK